MDLKNISEKAKADLFDNFRKSMVEYFPELTKINSAVELSYNTIGSIAIMTISYFDLCKKEDLNND